MIAISGTEFFCRGQVFFEPVRKREISRFMQNKTNTNSLYLSRAMYTNHPLRRVGDDAVVNLLYGPPFSMDAP